jgi:hypothetical protein
MLTAHFNTLNRSMYCVSEGSEGGHEMFMELLGVFFLTLVIALAVSMAVIAAGVIMGGMGKLAGHPRLASFFQAIWTGICGFFSRTVDLGRAVKDAAVNSATRTATVLRGKFSNDDSGDGEKTESVSRECPVPTAVPVPVGT